MILIALALMSLSLAGLYAAMTLINLSVYRAPPGDPQAPPVSISVLIPARDEAANIDPLLDSVLASEGVALEALVLDDDSSDATAARVAARAERDPRVRLIAGSPLPRGWNGKQFACWQLAGAARHRLLVFIDADVRLEPEALARIAAFMARRRLDLASGFPRQVTRSLAERLVIPQILVLLIGYLPLPLARRSGQPGFAAGCGQLIAVRRAAYDAAGGHRSIRDALHDGLKLPRAIRAAGGRTDLADVTALAACRMYRGWAELWGGFTKNAHEGMATPVALPVWTLLLGGGHILPFLLAPAAMIAGNATAQTAALAAVALILVARTALALRLRQSPVSVILHPVGVGIVLAIQWSALIGRSRGRPAVWRGRAYDIGR